MLHDFDHANAIDVTTQLFPYTTLTGASLLMVCPVWIETTLSVSGITLDSITFNGVALTFHTALSNSVNSEMWYLLNPDIGTYNVIITWGGPGIAEGGLASAITGAREFRGAQIENPLGTIQTTTGTGTSASVTVPSVEERHVPFGVFSSGSVLVDNFGVYQPGSFAVLTEAEAAQNLDYSDDLTGTGTAPFSAAGSDIESAVYGDNVMGWTLDASRNWTYWAIEVKAPSFLGIRAGQVLEF